MASVAIGSLKVGDQVTAYDPSTGKSSTQTVQHVWLNHDTDLLDVTLHEDGHGTQASSSDKTQQVATKAHGSQAPPSDETIHTTQKHPWLTTDRGWVPAGELRVGEQVVELGGRTATIAALAVRPGAATYYNLTVSTLHTYGVGTSRAVVHNANCVGNTVNNAKARGLEKALEKANHAYAEHTTVAVGNTADGRTLVSMNENVERANLTGSPDPRVSALQHIMGQGNWAKMNMTYVGPTELLPAGTLTNLAAHAEPYLLTAGAEPGSVGASQAICGACSAQLRLLGWSGP